MRSWHRDTIIVLRAGTPRKNAHGNPVPTATVEHTLSGVRVIPVSTSETEGVADITHRLLAPLRSDVTHADRVRWTDARGVQRTFEVVGEPLAYTGISGALAHIEASLKAVNL